EQRMNTESKHVIIVAGAGPAGMAVAASLAKAGHEVIILNRDIKGQGIYCYVTLNAGEAGSDALLAELRQHVRKEIGPIATPDHIQFTDGLPKTRSGKIMRRILRKIAENDFGSLGDTSTLADPSLVERLVEGRKDG
ncbi:MAG: acetyl-coenzyme A synthetase, partial [Erythrobacter sp. 34-65-8]